MKGWKENDKRIGLIARVIRNGSNGEMKLEIIVQIHNATIEVSPPPPPPVNEITRYDIFQQVDVEK